jgi:hypothetical protein
VDVQASEEVQALFKRVIMHAGLQESIVLLHPSNGIPIATSTLRTGFYHEGLSMVTTQVSSLAEPYAEGVN